MTVTVSMRRDEKPRFVDTADPQSVTTPPPGGSRLHENPGLTPVSGGLIKIQTADGDT